MIRLGVVGLVVAVTASAASAANPGANGLIAFVRSTEYRAYTDDAGSIWTVRADGTALRRLTTSRWGDRSPVWSPDGRRIAFVRAVAEEEVGGFEDRHEVFVMNANGTNVRRLTRNNIWDGDPTWSPDGKQIAFVRGMTRRERGVRPNRDIWVMRADGSAKRPVARTELVESEPSWAPRGNRIAYIAQRAELYYDEFGIEHWRVREDRELWTMRSNGTRRRATGITSASFRIELPWLTTEFLGAPDWSPEGRHLAVATARGMVTLRPDGADVRILGEGGTPAWSPDGRTLVFTRYVEPDRFVYTVTLDDEETTRQVTTNTLPSPWHVFDTDPAWQPRQRRN